MTRRDGKPFPRARCALDPVGTPPHFIEADAAGQVVFTLQATANTVLQLTVTHPRASGAATAGGAWQVNNTAYWPVDFRLSYMPRKGVVLQANPPQVAYFSVAQSLSGILTDVEIRLFRVRNIDTVVDRVLSSVSIANKPIVYPRLGAQQGPLPHSYTTLPLLDSSDKVQQIPGTRPQIDPRNASLLEVAARKDSADKEERPFAPKLCGVSLPMQVLRNLEAIPPSLLIYFRPTADQDFDGRPSGFDAPAPNVTQKNYQLNRYDDPPYSRSQYHFEWFYRRTFEYVVDPWAPAPSQFAAGLCHQIRAAGKLVGVIAPIPEEGASGNSFGQATDAGFIAELVLEVLAYADAQEFQHTTIDRPLRAGPEPGRIAAAGFSSGNLALSQFVGQMTAAPATNLVKKHLRELYMLDAPDSEKGHIGPIVFPNCHNYIKALANPDEGAFRCYTQFAYVAGRFADVHKALYPTGRLPGQPFDDTSERMTGSAPRGLRHRTAAFLPSAAWPQPPTSWVDMHSYIPATMVCHALRLSAFPSIP